MVADGSGCAQPRRDLPGEPTVSQILWLASYPKSGNTWLRAFLANYLNDGPKPEDINALPRFNFGDMRIEFYEKVSGIKAANLSWRDINKLRPRVHRHFANARQGLVFVKTHSILSTVEGIPTITPEVTFGAIYVVRNPLDVAVSFSHHSGYSIEQTVKALCDKDFVHPGGHGQVMQALSDWSGHVKSWLRAPGLYLRVLRYEDMVANPVTTFGTIPEFLKAPRDRRRLKKAVRFSSFKVLAEQEEEAGFREASPNAPRFFHRGRVGVWRETLSPEQADRIVACHRETMSEMGYFSSTGKLLV
jgi:hypothetical protein